ncbi:hypothetical protein C8J56DRAFT_1048934 [Mycena floridula]|nr:hypothetical protein C8J56DRAFT_1048934 [Mycena floridula]
MSFNIDKPTEIVIHIDVEGLKGLQSTNPSSQFFMVKLLPTQDNQILRLGRARPFDIGSTVATSGDFHSQTDRNLNFIAPADGWYVVKSGCAPGVYRGWSNAVASGLVGPSMTADWKYFRLREDAMGQYHQWAAANELLLLHDDGTYRATLGSFVDLDKVSDDGGDEEEANETSLLKEATEAYLKLSHNYLSSSPRMNNGWLVHSAPAWLSSHGTIAGGGIQLDNDYLRCL